jgi:hypothetical protein
MDVVGERKSFLLRLDENILEALRLWADDELRSLNGHVEYLLRKALKESGRFKVEAQARRKKSDASQP